MNFVPCGIVAEVIARTDSVRGVWKSPVGTDTTIYGIEDFMINLNNDDIGMLNVKAVNCLKKIPSVGSVIWGARTMKRNNVTENEWKYLAVRRTALFIEESLNQGLQWAVFEPNDEPLWFSIRSNVNSFLNDLFRQGAFSARSPNKAYFVKCDSTTTTQNDKDKEIVNVLVRFASLKPAEFVIIRVQLSIQVK